MTAKEISIENLEIGIASYKDFLIINKTLPVFTISGLVPPQINFPAKILLPLIKEHLEKMESDLMSLKNGGC